MPTVPLVRIMGAHRDHPSRAFLEGCLRERRTSIRRKPRRTEAPPCIVRGPRGAHRASAAGEKRAPPWLDVGGLFAGATDGRVDIKSRQDTVDEWARARALFRHRRHAAPRPRPAAPSRNGP